MPTPILKRLTRTTLALACLTTCLGFSGIAAAETRELSYLMPKVGSEYLYIGMGYDDADGNFTSLAGSHIVSSTVKVDIRPRAGFDINSFFMAMSLPVDGVESAYFVVDGSMLVQTGRHRYSYTLTTDQFNGLINPGRFSVESYGLGSDGNPIPLPAWLGASTGFYYTVDVASAPVPEPATAALLLGGLALLPLLARRRRG